VGEQIEYLYQGTWRPGMVAQMNPVVVNDVHTDKKQPFDQIRKLHALNKYDAVPFLLIKKKISQLIKSIHLLIQNVVVFNHYY